MRGIVAISGKPNCLLGDYAANFLACPKVGKEGPQNAARSVTSEANVCVQGWLVGGPGGAGLLSSPEAGRRPHHALFCAP
jgi:hypothetical protein